MNRPMPQFAIPPSTAPLLGALLKSARDIMRKGEGLDGNLARLLIFRAGGRGTVATLKQMVPTANESLPRANKWFLPRNKSLLPKEESALPADKSLLPETNRCFRQTNRSFHAPNRSYRQRRFPTDPPGLEISSKTVFSSFRPVHSRIPSRLLRNHQRWLRPGARGLFQCQCPPWRV